MAVLVTKWFGAFRIEGGRVEAEARFPLEPAAVAERLQRIREGDVLDEERALAQAGLEVLEPRLRSLGRVRSGNPFFDVDVPEPDAQLLHAACLIVARRASEQAAGATDRFLVHTVAAMDELTVALNTLVERLREWYALHFPEALETLTDPNQLAQHLAQGAERDKLQQRVAALAGVSSIGTELRGPELEAIQSYARSLAQLYEERARLEAATADLAARVAPRLSELVGPIVAGKLVAKAGSLERLAFLPASTIQTLGAETALFQHLRDGKRPPKHGILFQHGLVNAAPKAQRGRLSRTLATNAALAARLDHFRPDGNGKGPDLARRVDARAKAIRTAPRRSGDARRGPARGRNPPAKRSR